MKKLLIFGLIFCLLLSSFVFAADAPVASSTPSPNPAQAIAESQKLISNASLNNLVIPVALTSVTRQLFNIPSSDNVTLAYLVILIALAVFLFLVISSLMEFVPFFEGWKAWAASFVVVLIISIAGGVRDSAQIFLAFQFNFGAFASLSFVFIGLILVIVGLALMKLLKIIRDKVGIETAKAVGENISIKPLQKKLKEDGFR